MFLRMRLTTIPFILNVIGLVTVYLVEAKQNPVPLKVEVDIKPYNPEAPNQKQPEATRSKTNQNQEGKDIIVSVPVGNRKGSKCLGEGEICNRNGWEEEPDLGKCCAGSCYNDMKYFNGFIFNGPQTCQVNPAQGFKK